MRNDRKRPVSEQRAEGQRTVALRRATRDRHWLRVPQLKPTVYCPQPRVQARLSLTASR